MKSFQLSTALFLAAFSTAHAGEPTFSCKVVNYAKQVSSVTEGNVTTSESEVIPFDLLLDVITTVEMGGSEERFLQVELASLTSRQSPLGKKSYAFTALLVSRTENSQPSGDTLQGDIIVTTTFQSPGLLSGFQTALLGNPMTNSVGREVQALDASVICVKKD